MYELNAWKFFDFVALVLDRTEGVLPARSRHKILATVKPIRRVNYQFAVSYKLITPMGKESNVNIHNANNKGI